MEKEKKNRQQKKWFRWVILALMSLFCFAQYYIYDSVTPLATMIKNQLNYTNAEYGLLFSAYSAPNVFLFMVVLAGILVDKIGIKLSGFFYGFLCVLGAILTALPAIDNFEQIIGPAYNWLANVPPGNWTPELKMMLLGRTIFGIGAEAVLVVNNKVLAKWFLGKELAFAYGVNLTIMRLGTFLALNLQSFIGTEYSLITALWFAAFVMGAGLVAFVLYIGMEESVEKDVEGEVEETEEFHLKEALTFDSSFWFITLLCVTFYSAVFPFQAYAPDMLIQKFGYSDVKAGFIASMLILGTMIFTPIFGWFVDKYGKRATLMIYGSLLLIPCHLALALTHIPPVIPIFIVGISLSLVPAALWAAIPMMIKEHKLGTAFGIIGWVQNMGLMLFPWIAGKIADANTVTKIVEGTEKTVVDYTDTMLMFAALGIVGVIFAIALKRADQKSKGMSIEKPMIE